MKFYTSFFSNGNYLYVRGYDGPKQFFEKHQLAPTLYIKSNTGQPSPHTSFYGDPLKELEFNSVWDARSFIKDNKATSEIFGYPNFEYSMINELFTDEFDMGVVRTMNVDIETYVGDDCDPEYADKFESFPSIEDPHHAISLITFECDGEVHIFSLADNGALNEQEILATVYEKYPAAKYMNLKWKFNTFENEKLLLINFILTVENIRPDILTGWNTNGFDVPYICQRTLKILGEDTLKRLSPFALIDSRWFTDSFGRKALEYKIKGIELLDYLELYKKFELSPRENYKLETIAQLELGAGKLSYEGSFQSFYKSDWQTFVAYNIVDVLLIKELDKVLGFIDVAASMAYFAQCVYTDVFRVTRIWDNIIANYCAEHNVQVPTDIKRAEGVGYQGAFVKPTIPGKYEWIASFDIASLYPSIIMQQNISPETILPEYEFVNINAQELTDFDGGYEEAFAHAKDKNATLCANGALFSKEKEGVIPKLISQYMKGRKSDKKEMFKWANKVQYAKRRLNEL